MVRTAVIIAVVITAFAWAGHGDKQVYDMERQWCMEAGYNNTPVMPADMYHCARLGIALDNVIEITQ